MDSYTEAYNRVRAGRDPWDDFDDVVDSDRGANDEGWDE